MPITYSASAADPITLRSDCGVVAVFEKRTLTPTGKALDKASGGALSAVLKRGDMEGRTGQSVMLHDVPGITCRRLLLVGCGKPEKFSDAGYRQACAAAARAIGETGSRSAVLFLVEAKLGDRDAASKAHLAVQAVDAALYRFDQLKSGKGRRPASRLNQVVMHVADRSAQAAGAAVREAAAIAAGVRLAMDLGNLPGNVCTPSYLARQAQALGREHKAIRTRVLNEADMKKLGMGALLSVSRGSREPAKLIVMEYRGGARGEAPVALVGKGLTFDAGGISLKPAAAMDEMKYDMCGAASVFGTLKALAELGAGVNVVGVVPSSENLPDGAANKPGDIVTSMSGQTIEVLNTDAEGRLILCDALTYTERFKPAAVIDIATLTGACVVALGAHATGLFANDQPLADALLAAGRRADDRAWQLPLWDDYQQQLDTNFADMVNVGGREAGAVTAACFLARYTGKFKWAHLDIAGTAWKTGKDKGATGRPVPLLTEYVLERSRGRGARKRARARS
jgi:leucyl aminopeptidase